MREPAGLLETMNLPADRVEDKLITDAIAQSRPIGSESRAQRTAKVLGL
jgi:hypothetical protein